MYAPNVGSATCRWTTITAHGMQIVAWFTPTTPKGAYMPTTAVGTSAPRAIVWPVLCPVRGGDWVEDGSWRRQREAHLLYTSNRGGTISLDLDGKKLTDALEIASTKNDADPVAWRQWPHWNVMKGLAAVSLPKGKHILTIHILTNGNMNLAYFDLMPATKRAK